MAYTPHEGAEAILKAISTAEAGGFTVKLFANDITKNSSYYTAVIADFRVLTTETSWGGWGTSTSHRTISTSAWATASTQAGEVARSTAADLTWTFTTILTKTTKTGSFTNGSTLVTGLTNASQLAPGWKIEAPTAVTTACVINTIVDSCTVGISESATRTTAAAPTDFRPQVFGHILIGSASSKVYRVVSHEGWLPEKNGDYYKITPTLVMNEEE